MSEDLVFYYNPQSRGQIVHWMLEEVGATYRVELLRFDKGEHKAAAYTAINPMGKVPAIVHGGTVITECGAICAYLADAFPAAGLAPPTDQRGAYYRWMFFGSGCLEPALVDRMLERPAGKSLQMGYGSYADTLATLEAALTPGPYLTGEAFSAADVFVGAEIGWGLATKALEPRPAFLAYAKRCADRPAYRRFTEQAAELSKQLAS